jgi:hypothetical protein
VLKESLVVVLKYRKMAKKGRSKGGQQGRMYGEEQQGQGGRVAVGTHLTKRKHIGLQ